jgi:hypothetical protein
LVVGTKLGTTNRAARSSELSGTGDWDYEDAFDRHRAYFILLFFNFSRGLWSRDASHRFR